MESSRPNAKRQQRVLSVGMLLLAISMPALPTPTSAIEQYQGDAYAVSDGRVLYSESHWRYHDGGVEVGLVLYRCPDGQPFARKHLRAGTNAQAPDFDLTDVRSGYTEGVRSDGGSREVFSRTNRQSPERTAVFKSGADTVIDAGFDAFVRSHWDALATASVPLSFVVPSRVASLRFEARRIADESVDGVAARRLRLSLASWYGGLLPHIDVWYTLDTQRLVRYEGISNVHDAHGKNVVVRIEFPRQQRNTDSTPAEVDAAVAVPLTGTCRLSRAAPSLITRAVRFA